MAFEKYIVPSGDNDPKMAVSAFLGLMGEYIRGKLTSIEVIDCIEECLSAGHPSPVSLSSNEAADITSLLSDIDNESTLVDKLAIILEYRDVFDIAENKSISLYSIQSDLKTRLNFTEPTSESPSESLSESPSESPSVSPS